MINDESAEPSRIFARFAALVAGFVGLFVLAGWSFGLDQLTSLAPTWPKMARLTAISFMLAGAALWLAASGKHALARGAALLVGAFGFIILLRYAAGWNAHIEQLSFSAISDGPGEPPVRMAPGTAAALCMLGGAQWCASDRRLAFAHHALAFAALLVGWLGLSRYVFGGEPGVVFSAMALHTATVIVLLSVGILTLRHDAGIAALLASEGVGGGIARKMLPAAILVPLAAGALTAQAARRGVLSIEEAVSVFALSSAIVFVSIVWINAARGERTDRLRRRAEHNLRSSEERNQLIVETALDAVVTMNSAGLITGWNPQAERIFGWPRAEVIGRELAEVIIPQAHRAEHRLGLKRYLETGVARVLNRRFELSAMHREDREFPVEIAITSIGFGEAIVFSAFIRDITGRVRAEAALRESEQRFRTMANSAPVLIWMSGGDKRGTWFNQRWLDFVGRGMEQEIGDGWCDNLHPADFDRVLDTYHAAFDARRPYEVEYRLQRKDGAWRWLLERGTPIIGPTGEFNGYIGTCVDITEHRETVEQLRESRARFKTLAESLPQLVWTCLRDGYCDYVSRQWLDYTGRPEEQQLGSGWAEVIHPDDRSKVKMEWARVVTIGEPYDLSYRMRRFDGEYRWFKARAVPLRDPAGRILKWFGSNTDIEDFVISERRLKVQLERMQLLDRTTHAIGIHQQVSKVFEVVLQSLEEDFGVDFGCVVTYQAKPEQLVVASLGAMSAPYAMRIGLPQGTHIAVDESTRARVARGELLHEPDIRDSRRALAARLAAGGLAALVAAPIVIEDEVFGVLVVARRRPESFSSDDCEFLRQLSNHVALAAHQARLYDALQTAYQDLRETQQTVMQQERLRALGQIASGIAHDINNALSPAALYAQSMLTHEQGLSERARDHLEVIQRAIEDVAGTVQRMRAFYMPQGQELTLAPVEVNPILSQVIELTRARWSNMPQERGVVVQVVSDLAPNLPKILGAENEVRDALTNLLLNAVDALPDGGTVMLRTSFDARDREVIIEVQDTGVGMSETTRSRCLEPFFTTKGERGTGLGLPMVFGMVQRHGGQLEIDSELGKGTTMRLRLPSAPTGMSSSEPAPTAPSRPLRILLIDDDPMLLRSLRDALELDEHEVLTADGGQAGIDTFTAEQAAGRQLDAVVTDLGMPYVDGRKVAIRIHQLSDAVPIIMLTGWGHRLVASDDKPEHVDRVLSKPPKMGELRAALADLVHDAAAGDHKQM
jgi:PAS domain S-box-containing protein